MRSANFPSGAFQFAKIAISMVVKSGLHGAVGIGPAELSMANISASHSAGFCEP